MRGRGVAQVEITDKDSAQAWFATQPTQRCQALAARSALRSLPGLGFHAKKYPAYLVYASKYPSKYPVHLEGISDVERPSVVQKFDGLALPVLRAILTSGVAGACSVAEENDEVRSASLAATHAVAVYADSLAAFSSLTRGDRAAISAALAVTYSTAVAADSASAYSAIAAGDHAAFSRARPATNSSESAACAAYFTADSVKCCESYSAESAARYAAYSLLCTDASAAPRQDAPGAAFDARLWRDAQMPDGLGEGLQRLRDYWDSDPAVWGFWHRWYQSMLDGTPMDWALQEAVALIPDDDWQQGAAHVAGLIETLSAEFIASTHKEGIRLSAAGRLTLVPTDFKADRQLGLLIDTVEDALELATGGIRNELPEDAYQVRLLRRTFQRYANDPQRIEMDFERARASLIEDMAQDAIPASSANRDLVRCLDDGARAIRDSDPEIAGNRERLNRLRLARISEEDAQKVAAIAQEVAALSEGILQEDLNEDRFRLPGVRRDASVPDPVVPLGAPERNAALEGQAAQIRLYSRLTRTWLYLKSFDRAELSRLLHTEEAQVVGLIGSLGSIIGLIVALAAL